MTAASNLVLVARDHPCHVADLFRPVVVPDGRDVDRELVRVRSVDPERQRRKTESIQALTRLKARFRMQAQPQNPSNAATRALTFDNDNIVLKSR